MSMNDSIQTAGRAASKAIQRVAQWTGERVEDASMWLVNLLRELPLRVGRLSVTCWAGVRGLLTFAPSGALVLAREGLRTFGHWLRARFLAGAARLGILLVQSVDLVGLPELFSLLWRAVTRSSPLTGDEIMTVSNVLGPTALRYRDVRIAEGGLLRLAFRLNGGRAFTTFHTVNFPNTGRHGRANLDILVHELVHVYQHERVGAVYLGECVYAQATVGYSYGGPTGLHSSREAGKRYRDFNREQQAQIVQDYYLRLRRELDTAAYQPYIEEMREAKL